MWRGDRCNGNVLYDSASQQYFIPSHISGTAHHTTSHRIFQYHRITHYMAWCKIAWCGRNLVWCAMFCNAKFGVMCNVLQCQMWDVVPYSPVMWNKVRCKTYAIRCDAKCDVVQCHMWNGAMWCAMMVWYMGNMVVCWFKMWNWCGCGIPSDMEWCDAVLDITVRCEMQRGGVMGCVVWFGMSAVG